MCNGAGATDVIGPDRGRLIIDNNGGGYTEMQGDDLGQHLVTHSVSPCGAFHTEHPSRSIGQFLFCLDQGS